MPPGIRCYEDVLDLYSHPLLGPNWDHLVQAKTILQEPGIYTFSGAYGPITTSKSFIPVTIGFGERYNDNNEIFNRELRNWKEYLAAWDTGKSILTFPPGTRTPSNNGCGREEGEDCTNQLFGGTLNRVEPTPETARGVPAESFSLRTEPPPQMLR